MTTLQALQMMLDASGVTSYQVAKSIGRGSSYVSGMVWRGSCPSADLLARLAGACGYSLQLVPLSGEGSPLVIDGAGAADADGAGAAADSS